MKKRTIEEYYLGLDIGTNSVGYAVTDPQYKILKYHGEPMWGSHVFEEGSQCAERRGFRTARRRLNRRQQRVRFVQEIFAHEIEKVDKENNSFAWIKRKAQGRIYPWNYEEKIDVDASEQAFIDKMTNQCSYLPGEDVLPKYSLLYCKYEVLNEINNIKINGQRITVDCKKEIFGLFKRNKKVTVKRIRDFLVSNNYMSDSDEITGLDISVKSSLKSYHDFRRMLENKTVNEEDVEEIIKRLTYTEDKKRINKYLEENYPNISEEDRRYISKLKYKDFGRLSEKFLTGIKGVVKETGEILSVIQIMWETNDNLMQIIFSDHYTIRDVLEREREDYYSEHPASVEQILSDMYISNAVKRPIYRTLDIIGDVTKAYFIMWIRYIMRLMRTG